MEKASRFEYYVDNAGEWRWRLIAANGRIIADSSEGYDSRANCRRAIKLVIKVVTGGAAMVPATLVYRGDGSAARIIPRGKK